MILSLKIHTRISSSKERKSFSKINSGKFRLDMLQTFLHAHIISEHAHLQNTVHTFHMSWTGVIHVLRYKILILN